MKLIKILKPGYILRTGASMLLVLLLTYAHGTNPFIHSVISEENGRVYQYSVIFQEVSLKTNSKVTYYWHRNGQLRSTRGDYSGNILHGNYQEFDKSGRMLEKGMHHYGKKDGEWKSWNKNGEISKLEKWDKGFLKSRVIFDPPKRTIEKYKQNQLNGSRKVFNNDVKESEEHFRKGVQLTGNKKILKYLFSKRNKKEQEESDAVNGK